MKQQQTASALVTLRAHDCKFVPMSRMPPALSASFHILVYFTITIAVSLTLRDWLAVVVELAKSGVPKDVPLPVFDATYVSVVFLLTGVGIYAVASALTLLMPPRRASALIVSCLCGGLLAGGFLVTSLITWKGLFVIPSLWILSNGIICGGCLYFQSIRERFERDAPKGIAHPWEVAIAFAKLKHTEIKMLLDRLFQLLFTLAAAVTASMGILFADPAMWHGGDRGEHMGDCLSAILIFTVFSCQVLGLFFFVILPLLHEIAHSDQIGHRFRDQSGH